MSSGSLRQFDDFVDNDSTVTSTKTTNVCSRTSKRSKSKSGFKSYVKYMKSIVNGDISLYTHVRMLIETFVFQNPVQPIKFFEYYSEKLKEYHCRPRPDLDLEFLNNIELEVCKKITDIQNNKFNTNEADKLSYSYYDDDVVDEYLRHENENDFVENDESESQTEATVIQDISKINYMFNKAGCGLTNDEVCLIEIVINHSLNHAKFKNIRYWGKILGLKRNYYVLECEFHNKELEYKFRALNYLTNNKNATFDYENVYENEGLIDELDNEMFSMRLSHEQMYDENKKSSDSISLLRLDSNKLSQQTVHDSATDMFDYDKSESTCFPLLAESTEEDDHLSYEMFGFGANKKSYFVTNELYDEWTELPQLKPHHVIQSRDIKRYFVGDLESPVKSFPQFKGLEKHYLRAQIARITAETQISPRDYFLPGGNSVKSIRTRKLTPLQSRVLSQKYVHDYVINENYEPPSIYALLKAKNWVHHTPLISDEGVTNAWTEIGTLEKREGKETETFARGVDKRADMFLTVSDESRCAPPDCCFPPWKFELTNTFDHRATYVSVTSNIWPGAFAIAGGDKLSDCTYYGWGHERDTQGFERLVMGAMYQSEYPSEATDATEAKDPTNAEQLSYVERMREMKEEKRRMKAAAIAPKVEGSDDEERIISQYNYV